MTTTTPDLQAICEEVEAEWEMVGLSSDGGLYSDYAKEVARRFAALVRAQVIEEAAKVCEALAADSRQHPLCQAMGEACAARIREPDSGHSTARAGEASTARHSECRWPECSCYAPQGRGLCRYSPGASTAPLPLFAVGVALRKWESLQADGYRMQRIEFARSIDGQETRGVIDPWGRVLWKYGQTPVGGEMEKLRQEAIAELQAQVDEFDRLLKADAAGASTAQLPDYPRTPQAIREFIGPHFRSREDVKPAPEGSSTYDGEATEDDVYTLTVHDLLSAFDWWADLPPEWMKPHPQCDQACMYVCTEGFTRFPSCVGAECEHGQEKPSCGLCHDNALANVYGGRTASTGADNVSPGSNVQAESASPSVLLIRGEK